MMTEALGAFENKVLLSSSKVWPGTMSYLVGLLRCCHGCNHFGLNWGSILQAGYS